MSSTFLILSLFPLLNCQTLFSFSYAWLTLGRFGLSAYVSSRHVFVFWNFLSSREDYSMKDSFPCLPEPLVSKGHVFFSYPRLWVIFFRNFFHDSAKCLLEMSWFLTASHGLFFYYITAVTSKN